VKLFNTLNKHSSFESRAKIPVPRKCARVLPPGASKQTRETHFFTGHLMIAAKRTACCACVILVGVLYGFVGIAIALPSNHVRFWRLAAWGVSGAIYISHIAYEQF